MKKNSGFALFGIDASKCRVKRASLNSEEIKMFSIVFPVLFWSIAGALIARRIARIEWSV
jgi:hypothetical protein